MHAQGHRVAEAAMLVRASQGLLMYGKIADASEQAGKAMEAAGDHENIRANALLLIALANVMQGDLAAANEAVQKLLEGHEAQGLAPPLLRSLYIEQLERIADQIFRGLGSTGDAQVAERILAGLPPTDESSSDK
jgi:hypothetical protein